MREHVLLGVLSLLWRERRIDTPTRAHAIQRDEAAARTALERLVEIGLVEAHDTKKGRTYTLSPTVYGDIEQPVAFVRQVGFDPIQPEQVALCYVHEQARSREATLLICAR